MESCAPTSNYSITQAVENGSLIDITDLAKKHFLRNPTFLTSSFWNGPLKQSHEQLVKWVAMFGRFYTFLELGGLYGVRDLGDFQVLVEPNNDIGLMMVFGEPGCDFDAIFRRSTYGEKLVHEH